MICGANRQLLKKHNYNGNILPNLICVNKGELLSDNQKETFSRLIYPYNYVNLHNYMEYLFDFSIKIICYFNILIKIYF